MSSTPSRQGPETPSPSSSSQQQLDTSIPLVLDDPDGTPSRKCGVSPRAERTHRFHGTSIIATAWKLLPQRRQRERGDGSLEDAMEDSNDISDRALLCQCYTTSCTIFHRYYHCVSLTQRDVWSTSLASCFLASKLLNPPFEVSVQRLVLIFHHVYNKRRMYYNNHHNQKADNEEEHDDSNPPQQPPKLQSCFGFLSPLGPVYKEWRDVLIETENDILRKLGFTLYWIPEHHVHKYVGPVVELLFPVTPTNGRQDGHQEQRRINVGRRAWTYCNDAYLLDLVMTRYPSELIACAAVHLAMLDCGCYDDDNNDSSQNNNEDSNEDSDGVGTLPDTTDRTRREDVTCWWWEAVCGRGTNIRRQDASPTTATTADFVTVCNALLGLQQVQPQQRQEEEGPTIPSQGAPGERNTNDAAADAADVNNNDHKDTRDAAVGFVRSLLPDEGSFNDPGSFLWEMMDGALEQENDKTKE